MVRFRDNVYIGGYQDVEGTGLSGDRTAREHGAARELLATGITAILNVGYEIDDPPMPPPMIRYIKIGLTDSSGNNDYMKRLAVDAMEEMLHQGEKVLVHCAAGLSRSVYVAVMAVARMENKDWREVFDELQQVHPFALIGPLFHGEDKYYRFYKEQEEQAEVESRDKVDDSKS